MMECKKKVNDIARKILPKDIPVYVPIRVSDREPDITIQFRKILPKLTTVKMKKATKYVFLPVEIHKREKECSL